MAGRERHQASEEDAPLRRCHCINTKGPRQRVIRSAKIACRAFLVKAPYLTGPFPIQAASWYALPACRARFTQGSCVLRWCCRGLGAHRSCSRQVARRVVAARLRVVPKVSMTRIQGVARWRNPATLGALAILHRGQSPARVGWPRIHLHRRFRTVHGFPLTCLGRRLPDRAKASLA